MGRGQHKETILILVFVAVVKQRGAGDVPVDAREVGVAGQIRVAGHAGVAGRRGGEGGPAV